MANLQLPSDLFESARLKLTAFYFGVLVLFCLVLTFGVRTITSYELNRGGDAERGAVQHLFKQYYTDNDSTPALTYPGDPGDQYFANTQQEQADETRTRLNRDFIIFDLSLLAIGAVVSYWYAGRTLRPIEEMHEQQKRFTSDASHELRTPLASMRLENEVFLRQKGFSEQEARDQIASNLEEVDRLERLATNLLALNRYEHGGMVHKPVVVGDFVGEAVERVQHGKNAKKIRFVQDVMPAKVDVNHESMVELIAILLDNAVKYGPKDGKVEVGGSLQGETYTLTVRDHGPGIAEQDLPHIFDRMYRGDKARSSKVSGHGIGLSLARQIADANEATLEGGMHLGAGRYLRSFWGRSQGSIISLRYTLAMHVRRRLSPRERVTLSLVGLTGVSGALFVAGAAANHSSEFSYLIWNLFLAWTPLVIAMFLLRSLRTYRWSDWLPLALTFIWLLLLPNSFYMISDFVHVQDVVRNNLLYDVVMFTSFIFTGVLLGFSSLVMIHVELRKRITPRAAHACITLILLLCSYAIYLGRDLRWNSWDVFTNPAGILFDVSDHFIHPFQSGVMYTTTISFFVLLGSLYVAGWHISDATRSH